MRFLKILSTVPICLVLLVACESGPTRDELLKLASEAKQSADWATAIVHLKSALSINADDVDVRWELANAYLALGDAQSAIKEYDRAKALGYKSPDVDKGKVRAMLFAGQYDSSLLSLDELQTDTEVLTLRGQAHHGLGQLEVAERLYKEALGRDPKHYDSLVGMSRIALAHRDFESAQTHINRAVEIDGSKAAIWIGKAEIELAKQQYQQAVISLDKALAIESNNREAQLGLGQAFIGLGDLDAAQKQIDAVLARFPKYPIATYLKAVLLLERGNKQQSKDALTRILADFPNYGPAAFLLGKMHVEDGEQEQATARLARYVDGYPAHAEAILLLAKLYQDLGQPDEMLAVLKAGVEATPSEPTLNKFLADIYLLSGLHEQARHHYAIAGEAPEQAAQGMVGSALSHLARGSHEEAIKELETASQLSGSDTQAAAALVLLHIGRAEIPQARAAAAEITNRAPDSPIGDFLLGQIEQFSQNYPLAKTHYQTAYDKDPKFVPAIRSLALIARVLGDLEEAQGHYQSVLNLAEEDTLSLIGLASIAGMQGNQVRGLELLEKARVSDPDRIEARMILAGLHLQAGNFAESENVALEALSIAPNHPEVVRSVGLAQIGRGDNQSAIKTLQTLLELVPQDVEAHILLGAALKRAGRLEEARAALKAALSFEPNNLAAIIALTEIELRAGDLEQASKYISEAKAQSNAPKDSIALLEGRLLALQGKTDQSESVLRSISGDSAQWIPAQLALASVHFQQGDPQLAEETYLKIIEAVPNQTSALLALAQLDLQRGDVQKASDRFQLINSQETNAQAMVGLANIELRAGNPTKAISLLQAVQKLEPDNLPVHQLLVDLYLSQGETDKALSASLTSIALAPSNSFVVTRHARVLAATGQSEAAISSLKDYLVESPDNALTHFELARIYDNLGQLEPARDHFTSGLEIAPQRGARVRLIEIHRALAEFEPANAQLEILKNEHPNVAMTHTIEGDLLLAMNKPTEASAAYRKAAELQPSSALVHRQARAQIALDDYDAATATLDSWLQTHPDDINIKITRADTFSMAGKKDAAIVAYEAIIRDAPNNHVALNNLAVLHHEQGNFKQAIELSQQALEARPGDALTMDTYGWALLADGQNEQALAAIQNASVAAPHNNSIRLHLALALLKLGDIDSGTNTLHQILVSESDPRLVERAKEILAQIE